MVVLIVVASLIGLDCIFGLVYLGTGGAIGKWFYHNILGWHLPQHEESFDGCSWRSTCKFCGKEIEQDSQGNWY